VFLYFTGQVSLPAPLLLPSGDTHLLHTGKSLTLTCRALVAVGVADPLRLTLCTLLLDLDVALNHRSRISFPYPQYTFTG
ncbi:unnamed protein product, partial [Coregonus sp. 'balchen']